MWNVSHIWNVSHLGGEWYPNNMILTGTCVPAAIFENCVKMTPLWLEEQLQEDLGLVKKSFKEIFILSVEVICEVVQYYRYETTLEENSQYHCDLA